MYPCASVILCQKITDRIIKNRLDIIEVHYGYNWQKIGRSDWYLNIDTFLSLRSGNIQSVLNTHAITKYGENVGSIHTRRLNDTIPVFPSFGTPITSTQNSGGANSREATIDLISSESSASSQNSNANVLTDSTNKSANISETVVEPKPKTSRFSIKDDSSDNDENIMSEASSSSKNKPGFKTPSKTNDRVLRPRSDHKKSKSKK